jgi:hypothetical protein
MQTAAKALKLRTGENPAAWHGNLKHLLPSSRKLHRKKGYRSAPYTKMPKIMTGLRYDGGVAARCVEIGILTVARSQEIRLMEWAELDFEAMTWRVPAEKMKIKGELEPKPHLVPLSDRAVKIIRSMPQVLAFCLSHRIDDEAELSYRDSEMIARRREALQAWADFIKPRKNTSGAQPPERSGQSSGWPPSVAFNRFVDCARLPISVPPITDDRPEARLPEHPGAASFTGQRPRRPWSVPASRKCPSRSLQTSSPIARPRAYQADSLAKSGLRRSANAVNASRASAETSRSANIPFSRST